MRRRHAASVLAAAFGAAAALTVAGCGGEPEIPDGPGWTRLANGLRVFVRPIEGAKDVAVLAVFEGGSDHDPDGRSGLAHLAEHLLVTAAAGKAPARTVDAWTAAYKGRCAAFTMEDSTWHLAVVPAHALDAELTDVAARMSDLRIETADLERERPRVLQQIEETHARDANPWFASAAAVTRRIRPSLDPEGRGGSPADVGAITIDDVRERAERFYRPANARLVLAGAVESAEALRLVTSRFGGLPGGRRAPRAPEHGRPEPGREEIDCGGEAPDAAVTRVVSVAWPGPQRGDPDGVTMLYVAMRAMQPPGSFLPGPDSRSGVVTFRWIGREDAPVDDIVRAADDLVAAIAASPPEPEEVERTQRFLRETTGRDAGFLLPDFPEAAAMRIAACAISGIDTDRACAQLAAMTKDDVARVAAKWLAPGRRVVVAARGVKPEREERVDTPYEKALAKARQVRNERQAASDLASGLLPEVRVALTWDEAAQTMRRTIGGVEYADDEALKQAIRNAHDALVKRGKRDAPVTLDGDVRIPWAEVIKVVNLVKALGIDKLEFAMGAPPKPKDEPK